MVSLFSFSRNIQKSGLLENMIDVHSHLLPGVDDDMASSEESYDACKYLERMGVKRIFLTPHMIEELPDNHPVFLRERFDEFVKNNPTCIKFSLAGEYMLDNGFDRQIQEGLLTISGKYVLVETSYMAASPDMRRMLYELSISGYQPLIAHPERYLYMTLNDLFTMKKLNYSLQLNLMSLVGIYGKEVQKRALFLLKGGHYDFIGSDIHDLNVYRRALSNLYLSKGELDKISMLMDNNNRLKWE